MRLWILSLAVSLAVHGALLVTLGRLFSGPVEATRVDLPRGGAAGVRVFLLPGTEVESQAAPATREVAVAQPPSPPVERHPDPRPPVEVAPEAPPEALPPVAPRPAETPRATPEPPQVATAAPSGAPAVGSSADRLDGGFAGVVRAPAPDGRNRPPEYPEEARRRRQQGDVLLHLVIEADGDVARVFVARSSGFPALDDAAMRAAQRWRFEPARQDGVAIASEVDVPIAFLLR